ncbi:SPL family radical SAM protein [Anaerocolumna xylanovorans]|uniref:Spore photoproduct lyase n=1 Tax=Anaerocolumna xylanovorans DSM 12503 TaxID=1121345 RepID=A0A1M7XZY7_9FIRM|nr:DNA repair photolyase [Anaerocolumna xylanovorans]SHO44774.1 spore photoproduct lyase [Anaerocolumna xylanovorans DSM 12503]
MTTLRKTFYNSFFSHIYIEKEAYSYPVTQQIIKHYPKAELIPIGHYKDVFNRSGQNYTEQKKSPSLILAKSHSSLIYEGAPTCQNFGNNRFYYTSCVMNCIYDCEYCYLQGMFPSANLVVFVNLEDTFHELERLLAQGDIYLCISYDTDLLAIEPLLGYVKAFHAFAASHKGLTIECRTKSAAAASLKELAPLKNFIFAWTLSPPSLQETLEHHTPSLSQRLNAIDNALSLGFPVRLCFDPLLAVKDWKEKYSALFCEVFKRIPPDKIQDASLGCFRIPKDFMKIMRKQRKDSYILQYPYSSSLGVLSYEKALAEEILDFCTLELTKWIKGDNIYLWKE